MQNLIFNSDDFGISNQANKAIMLGYLSGVITSTCLMANGNAYQNAVKEVLLEIPNIGLGIHLNIIEGISLTNPSMLCNSHGEFNKGFVEILSKSNEKEFLVQVESEFRAQIEKILNDTYVDHINSHVHTHAIPSIFKIVCKLSNEYNIKVIRTQYEKPYFVPKFKKHISLKYPVNLLKLALLNSFTIHNRKIANSYGLFSNDYLVGVTYTGYMDEDAVLSGLRALKNTNKTAEILIHPWYFEKKIDKPTNYNEFLITQSKDLKEKIKNLGFNLTNYKSILEDTTAEFISV